MASADEKEEDLLPKEQPETLFARQSEELKDLRKRLERIRCSIPKKDRAGRARAVEEATERENELKRRHGEERRELGINESDAVTDSPENLQGSRPQDGETPTTESNESKGSVKESKAARRRRKKAEQEAESQRRVQEEKARMGRSPKFVESEAIEAQLRPQELRIHPIPADGHCLYSAVAHQMKVTKLDTGVNASVEELRHETADYLSSHKEEFIPFIETVDGDEEKFREYCSALRKEAVWGGQVELKVMAEILDATIEVYAAGMPMVRMGTSDKTDRLLRLSFHRHYYGLGEHYNSVVQSKSS